MDLTTVVLLVGISYALGLFWYGLLLGRTHESIWRTLAFPFLAIVCAEALSPAGPVVAHVHLVSALVAALAGVLIDWAVGTIHGSLVAPRTQRTAAAGAR